MFPHDSNHLNDPILMSTIYDATRVVKAPDNILPDRRYSFLFVHEHPDQVGTFIEYTGFISRVKMPGYRCLEFEFGKTSSFKGSAEATLARHNKSNYDLISFGDHSDVPISLYCALNKARYSIDHLSRWRRTIIRFLLYLINSLRNSSHA